MAASHRLHPGAGAPSRPGRRLAVVSLVLCVPIVGVGVAEACVRQAPVPVLTRSPSAADRGPATRCPTVAPRPTPAAATRTGAVPRATPPQQGMSEPQGIPEPQGTPEPQGMSEPHPLPTVTMIGGPGSPLVLPPGCGSSPPSHPVTGRSSAP
jgi:hypothetical protein